MKIQISIPPTSIMKPIAILFWIVSLSFARECITPSAFIAPWEADKHYGNSVAFEQARKALEAKSYPAALSSLKSASQGDLPAEIKARLAFLEAELSHCVNLDGVAAGTLNTVLQFSQDSSLRQQANQFLAEIPPQEIETEDRYQIFLHDSTIANAKLVCSQVTIKNPRCRDVMVWLEAQEERIWQKCVSEPFTCHLYFQTWPEAKTKKASIGLTLVHTADDQILTYPIPGFPAEQAGVPIGVPLYAINGISVKNIKQATLLLQQGDVGSSVELSLMDPRKPQKIPVRRIPVDLSLIPPLDQSLIERLSRDLSDTIDCKNNCTQIVLGDRTVSSTDLKLIDSLLSRSQKQAFAMDELVELSEFASRDRKGFASATFGAVSLCLGIIGIIANQPPVSISSFGIFFGSIIYGSRASLTAAEMAAFIQKHNERLKRPGHVPAGRLSIFK